MTLLRTSRSLVAGMAAGAACALLLALTLPLVAGGRSFTVMSGSMRPALGVGDVVLDERIAPLDARVGDVVTFQDPGHASRLITHRLRSVRARGGRAEMVTKGDANNTVERWSVPVGASIGRVRYRIPVIGYALATASGRYGRLLLIALPAVALAAFELVALWRTPRKERPDASPA